MAAKVAFRDHGRIIDVPASLAVIGFSCMVCDVDFSSHIEPGARVSGSFGRCPRCMACGLAKDISMDFDKVRELLEEQGKVVIAWDAGGKE